MKLQEAYNILGLAQGASPEEAKKQYRKLTKEFHPDINKDPGAEDRFKKINEAYQVISTGKSTDREDIRQQQSNMYNPFDPFGSNKSQPQISPVELFTTLSFKESVLGIKKDFKFQRKSKCQDCNGQGEIAQNNGCDNCGGKGQITSRQGNMVFIRTCDKCFGRTANLTCTACSGEGVLDSETSISVSIPGGVQTGNVLRLNSMGHFAGTFGPLDQYTDAFLHITVNPDSELVLHNTDVVSSLKISLLEAVQGCQKTVRTIMGDRNLEIKALSRNKDEILIPNLGVNGKGNHKIILDVFYPDDINILIDALSVTER